MATLKDRAYHNLKAQIIVAEPGTVFSVRKSAAELKLSYTPVREALMKLKSEGLLEVIPNVGFSVVQMDFKSIRSIYQSRECVERYVLPQVVEKIDEDDLLVLRSYIARQKAALSKGDLSIFTEMDEEFHVYLIDLLQNKQITDFYRSIRNQYRIGSQKVAQKHSCLPVEEHEQFLQLIEEKQFKASLEYLYHHTNEAVERMKEGFVKINLYVTA